MKLSRLIVYNFRSIKACDISFSEVSAIIGENSAGKTAILRALNSVFNWDFEKAYFADNTHQYAPRTKSRITVIFDDVPSKEVYTNKTVNGQLTIKLTYSYGNTTKKKALSYVTDNEEFTIDDSFINEIKKDIDYVYIPASRSNRDLTWDGNSIYKRVLTSYSKHYNEKRDNISKNVVKVADSLKTSIFKKLENEIEKASMLDSNSKYLLQYNESIDYSIFLDRVGLNIYDNGREYPVTEHGSGIKSLSVIALYRVLAQLEEINVILGIEEPETNLHPHAQKKLIASIKNERHITEVQAIMATHSTVIIDELNHEDIILARRIKDEKRGFNSTYTQLEKDFWTKYNLDNYKHSNFFRYKNSEFFFAKYVLITESITDAQVISHLIEDGLNEKKYYVSILNLDGVKNLKYPYFLLKSLGIPFSMVVDHDVIATYDGKNLDDSRDMITYLPKYLKTPNKRNHVMNDLWNTQEKWNDLTKATSQSYTRLFEVCAKKETVYNAVLSRNGFGSKR